MMRTAVEAPATEGPKKQRPLGEEAKKQKSLEDKGRKRWIHENQVLNNKLRADAKAESLKNPWGPSKDTLYGNKVGEA
eukprot:5650538-Pyramimonas_sp.AAC.1